ncbi:inosine-5'-monophosphate dehydrogenase [Neorickettsia helminthoeca str. Oregon]|uniref:Inosine-5'-monophosphate dehydrogenase n=2 Tax=Neorickettsia helminthoeca TaxID=33994 RepID=X5H433_9RICK|nr:inosine-5'-monophosphate dehydrogenase [Neorickettsia helminthoeca str. Oregon]
MDMVTGSALAIELAKHGGIGVIHRNMSPKKQALEIRKVKKYESWIVSNPITISPDDTIQRILELKKLHGYSGLPVVDEGNRLIGILTNRDIRFIEETSIKVSDLMTTKNLITVREGVSYSEAQLLLHKNRIERLIVVDDEFKCVGLITVKDITNFAAHPNASKDSKSRLRVGAAIGATQDFLERAEVLVKEDVDVLVIDTAHAHTRIVGDAIRQIKNNFIDIPLIAGNIATAEAAEYLIKAGVDGIKVGIGPGSICTTRVVTGVGVPQFTAILDVANACKNTEIKVIADGGIRYSGDIAKAIAAGADCVMIGSLFAGTEESPGEVVLYQGRSYKSYRGMGSVGAMSIGSADRYFQNSSMKLVPEGVEGLVPFKGALGDVVYQLIGGVKSSMGYTGNKSIEEMKNNCNFINITAASNNEGHPHDIVITHESPNYSKT